MRLLIKYKKNINEFIKTNLKKYRGSPLIFYQHNCIDNFL